MTDTHHPELIYLYSKHPLTKGQQQRLSTVLPMYGYYLVKLVTPDIQTFSPFTSLSDTTQRPMMQEKAHCTALVIQCNDPLITSQYGGKINTRILKAVKGVVRKIAEIDATAITPKTLDNHLHHLQRIAPETITPQAALRDAPHAYTVLETYKNSRTRIQRIAFDGQEAVCKIFLEAPGAAALASEIQARKVLAKTVPELPGILYEDRTYFIMPYHAPAWSWHEDGLSLFPLLYAEKCIDIMRRIHATGWAVLDWHQGNFLYTDSHSVKIIDLEAFRPQPYLSSFEISADIVGHEGYPYQQKMINYTNTWQPIVGLTLQDLLYASPVKKRVKRALYYTCQYLPRRIVKRAGKIAGVPLKLLLMKFYVRPEKDCLVYKYSSR